MVAVNFPDSNSVFASENPDFYPLPAEVIPGPSMQINTCWELSKEELEEVMKTGHIWVSILSFGQPLHPMLLSTRKPSDHDDAD